MTGLNSCSELEQVSYTSDCCQGITADFVDTIIFNGNEQCLDEMRAGAIENGFVESVCGIIRERGPGSRDELSFDKTELIITWRVVEI